MTSGLKIGDRVHTTRWNHQDRYLAGDKGTVVRTLKLHDGGLPCYQVAMDRGVLTSAGVLFDSSEIEADL